MLKSGILNPHILSLLARIRHTNTLVIADRGFPFWPQIETVDISLVDGVPRVLDVLNAIRANHARTRKEFAAAFAGVPLTFEPHIEFKKRVPHAIGLIRTGETIQYANMIIESA